MRLDVCSSHGIAAITGLEGKATAKLRFYYLKVSDGENQCGYSDRRARS